MRGVPDHLKTQQMCNKAVEEYPWRLSDFPHHLKTQGMCEKTIEDESGTLEYVPNYFKVQRMCEKAVENEPYTLKFVPDWFVTKEQIGLWMMKMSIAMMMRLLSGTMTIKNGRLKKQK